MDTDMDPQQDSAPQEGATTATATDDIAAVEPTQDVGTDSAADAREDTTGDTTKDRESDTSDATTDEASNADASDDSSDDSSDDDADDVDEDDDRLDAKVRRRIREKNRENKRLRERATSAERTLIAYRVAEKSGIPLSLADRLKGSTEDEMAADAADMLALMGRKPRVTPTDLPDDGRSPAGKGTPPSYDDLAESLFNR